MKLDPFMGMHGLTLEAMKGLARAGRAVGKVELCRYGDRWLMVHRPPGRQSGRTFYLMGEKSQRPRLFAKLDTAVGIAHTMMVPGVYVNFMKSIPVIENKV